MRSQGFAISILYPIMKAMARKGADFRQFCREASFDADILNDVEARIDELELERLISKAAEYTKDENFGLHQGELTEVADMGMLGYVMTHSETIARALQAYQRYNVILCSGYNLDWEELGEDVLLRFSKSNSAPMSRQCQDDMVSSVYHMMVRMSHRPIPVHELQFTYAAPVDLSVYVSMFGITPRFGGKETYLRMSREVLQYPILYSDPRLLKAFEPIAEELKNKLVRGKRLSDRVYQWMMSCLPAYFPTLQQTAEAFRMSPRSLQVKLSEEGTSYNDLSAGVRMEMAKAHLNQNEYSISEIAYLLNYSEPSAFHSAFKKWTGLTPGQYRAEAMKGMLLKNK